MDLYTPAYGKGDSLQDSSKTWENAQTTNRRGSHHAACRDVQFWHSGLLSRTAL